MRAVEAIVILVVLGLIVLFFIAGAVNRVGLRIRARRLGDQPWRVVKDKSGNATQVQLEKYGESPYLIGPAVPISLPHYEYEEALTERLLEAESKANALNRRLP